MTLTSIQNCGRSRSPRCGPASPFSGGQTAPFRSTALSQSDLSGEWMAGESDSIRVNPGKSGSSRFQSHSFATHSLAFGSGVPRSEFQISSSAPAALNVECPPTAPLCSLRSLAAKPKTNWPQESTKSAQDRKSEVRSQPSALRLLPSVLGRMDVRCSMLNVRCSSPTARASL